MSWLGNEADTADPFCVSVSSGLGRPLNIVVIHSTRGGEAAGGLCGERWAIGTFWQALEPESDGLTNRLSENYVIEINS